MVFRGILAFLAAGFMAVAAAAQDRLITVVGHGQVNVVPDVGVARLGVETTGETAGEALAQMSTAMTDVIAAAKDAGLPDRAIRTSRLNLSPIYDRRNQNRPVVPVVGYHASNQITVRVEDVGSFGSLLDALTQAGANTIQSVSFEVSDPAAALAQARRTAVADARAKAELYADAAGITLGPVVRITEGGAGRRPDIERAALGASPVAVPIQAGETTVSAAITLVFAIADKATDD
ncbi:MAG: SIMPL domain-containing protein [Pseudomonadota bacterium]